MYVRGLIPKNSTLLAESVPIDEKLSLINAHADVSS